MRRWIVLFVIIVLLFFVNTGQSAELSLQGQHRFQVGDDPTWSQADFDDSDWEFIDVPQDWDTAGLDFDEWIGWYRIHFEYEPWMSENASVLLGPVSDADEVWLNGEKIGSIGTIGDWYETSGLMPRLLRLPPELLKTEGRNVLSIRVMRVYFSGGLLPSARLSPAIGDHRELTLRVVESRRYTEITISVILTVWTAAVVFGLVLFRESELRQAFRTLSALMLFYVAVYVFQLPQVVALEVHNPVTELIVNASIGAIPWLFLNLTQRILRQPAAGWHSVIVIVIGVLFSLSVFVLKPPERMLMLIITLIVVVGTGGICAAMCARALRQRVPGSLVYSTGFASLFFPTLTYAFPAFVIWVEGVPLDAFAAAFFVLCCFSVLMIRFRLLRNRVELTSQALLTAQEDERRRLSRELHDGVNQSVFAVRLALQMEHEKLEKEQDTTASTLSGLIQETENIGNELRRVVRELRPSILEQMDIAEAIRWHAAEMEERCELQIQIDADERVTTSDGVKDHLYRIFQEALRNTMTHADATHVEVSVRCESGWVQLNYSDDGRGFSRGSLQTQGFGLNTMEERAALLGGHCLIRSSESTGVRIEVRVPDGLTVGGSGS